MLFSLRRVADGTREMEVAHRLDPLAHVITLSLAIGYAGQDRNDDAAPLFAQGLAQQPQAWYGWRLRFGHDLARRRFDDAMVALQQALKDRTTDKRDVLARFAPLWASPLTREMATDSLIAKGPAFAAVPLARYLRSDSVVVAVVDRIARDPAQIEARNTRATYSMLGPRLREDPRLQPAFRRLGFPDVTSPGSTR